MKTPLTYSEKLKDVRWQMFRCAFMRSKQDERPDEPLKCEDCGAADCGFEVHHKRYFHGRDPWDYAFEDCRLLCDRCHDTIHDVEQYARGFIISLPPHLMAEMRQVFEELNACRSDQTMKIAMARAKNAIRDVNDFHLPKEGSVAA